MAEQIVDGTGTGNKVKVNSSNELHTNSVQRSFLAEHTETGDSIGLNTPLLTVTATGGRVMYMKNTHTSKGFHITNLWFNWNGGSTNYNRPFYGSIIFGDTAPTTNTTTSGGGVLNQGITKTVDLDLLYWDETGDGMTGQTNGNTAFNFIGTQGANDYFIDGSIVLANGSTMTITAQGVEIGEFSVNILGYFEED